MLWDSNKYTTKTVVIADSYLTPLCQHMKLPVVQHADRIKRVDFILKVLCQLPVCVMQFVHHPDLPCV